MVVFVVKGYAVREAEKWRYAIRKAKIGRYAVRKGGRGCHPLIWSELTFGSIKLKVEFHGNLTLMFVSLCEKGVIHITPHSYLV